MKLSTTQNYFAQTLELFTLERGLIIGFIFILIGGLGSGYSFWFWKQQSFGPLIPTHTMRILIPSVTALILGMQCIFASFFMSVLELHSDWQKNKFT